MPALAASGMLSTPIYALARLVASSSTFCAVVGASSAAEALTHVYFFEASDQLQDDTPPGKPRLADPRPRAIIYLAEDWKTVRQGPGTWSEQGGLNLAFEFTIPSAYRENRRNEALWFANQLGAILEEMRTNSGAADAASNPYLNASAFELFNGPMPAEDYEPESFWGAELRVTWPS